MNDNELEIAILEKYIAHFKLVGEKNHKCARELDMREVLREITGDDNQDIEFNAKLWHNRLAPHSPGKSIGVLRPCSDGTALHTTHKYHARAFTDVINNQPAPAWDRIRELQDKLVTKENKEELLQLNPNIYGMGLNLKEAWKRIIKWFKRR
jgi:hypothetical protein